MESFDEGKPAFSLEANDDETKVAPQHCYITGGSSGLGLALAKMLSSQGAHVSIVARGSEKLADALAEIEVISPSNCPESPVLNVLDFRESVSPRTRYTKLSLSLCSGPTTREQLWMQQLRSMVGFRPTSSFYALGRPFQGFLWSIQKQSSSTA